MTYFVDAISARKGAEGQAVHLGKFSKLEEAVVIAKKTVDNFLRTEFKVGMTANTLFACYEERGLFPFIFLDDDEKTFNVRSFNHIQYAMERCDEICGANTEG